MVSYAIFLNIDFFPNQKEEFLMKKLKPGRVAAHVQFRKSILRQLKKDDQELIKSLLEGVSPKMQPLFDADPDILCSLLETGSCVRRYKEPKGEAQRLFPRISVLRSRLRTLRKTWAGVVKISIRKVDAAHTRVRFTAIEALLM